MFWVIHAILGVYFGFYFKSVWLVVLVGLVSHFFLDWVPHWDCFDHDSFRKNYVPKIDKKQFFVRTFDGLLAIAAISFFYVQTGESLVLIGAFAALFPDISKLFYFTRLRDVGWYKRYLLFHSAIQNDADLKLGLFTQFLALVIFLMLILNII